MEEEILHSMNRLVRCMDIQDSTPSICAWFLRMILEHTVRVPHPSRSCEGWEATTLQDTIDENTLSQQPTNNLCRMSQRAVESTGITPTGLRQIRPSTTLAANLRRQQPDDLSSLHPCRQIFRDTDDQRHLAV